MNKYPNCQSLLIFLLAFVAMMNQGGCSIPDVAPFAEATVALRQATIVTGEITIQAMLDTPQPDGAGGFYTLTNSQHPAKRLQNAWSVRLNAMDVLTGYADSLAQIVNSATVAEKTTQDLVKSVQQLSTQFGAANVFSNEAGALVSLLAANAIKLKAAHDLRSVVLRAHPVVTDIAKIVKKDMSVLEVEFASQSLDIVQKVQNTFGPMNTYRTGLRSQLAIARVALVLSNINTIDKIEKIEKLIAATESEHERFLIELKAAQNRRKSGRDAFRVVIESIDRWIAAHGDLMLAIEQRRKPNVRLLLSMIEEIKVAVDNVKKSR